MNLNVTFNDEASIYDNTTNYLLIDYDNTLDKAVEAIPFSKNSRIRILDLGCGTGNLETRLISQYPNAEIVCIDWSSNMLRKAMQKTAHCSSVTYVLEDIFQLETLDIGYFDVVLATYVFHNFEKMIAHQTIYKLIEQHLSIGGVLIVADLVELSTSEKIVQKDCLISRMKKYNLADDQIQYWLKSLGDEDHPLSVDKNIELFADNGFINTTVYYRGIENSIFLGYKKLDLILLKAELLLYGVHPNNDAYKLYAKQNPDAIRKTGNNGIFLSINELDILVTINHKQNKISPYEFIISDGVAKLYKYGIPLDIDISVLHFPDWMYRPIHNLNDNLLSEYFVYEGRKYMHLAYKSCSFDDTQRCKFCGTARRNENDDNINKDPTAEEICQAIFERYMDIPDDVHFCLGGGTYLPLENNVEFFSTIIKGIRSVLPKNPIWVEMVPPKISEIDRLISEGATSFGFNIEVWDEEQRRKICPGKSLYSRREYLNACKHVIDKLGSGSIGSCLIVGLDSYEHIKEGIDTLIDIGVEPCVLPYRKYDYSNSMKGIDLPTEYFYDFVELSKYSARECWKHGIVFHEFQGCLQCPCCTIMHDCQSAYNN